MSCLLPLNAEKNGLKTEEIYVPYLTLKTKSSSSARFRTR